MSSTASSLTLSEPPKYKDYYQLLSIKKENITDSKVKKAFMKKALLWHPDKAKTETEVQVFTKMYEELQQAYKILSTEGSRKKYDTVKQSTSIDFITEDRDRSYNRDAKYTKFTQKGYSFDRDSFLKDFKRSVSTIGIPVSNNTVNAENSQSQSQSQSQTDSNVNTSVLTNDLSYYTSEADNTKVKQTDYEKYLKEREQDTSVQNFKYFSADNFDRNKFHESFDFIKAQSSKDKGLTECAGDPSAYSPDEYNNDDTTNRLNDGFYGNLSEYSKALEYLKTHEGQYGQEGKLDAKICQDKILEIEEESDKLKQLKEFCTEKTEMEKLFERIFADEQKAAEGLEAPKDRTVVELQFQQRLLNNASEKILIESEFKKRSLLAYATQDTTEEVQIDVTI
jgi:curved DNA-binding protein CbpA